MKKIILTLILCAALFLTTCAHASGRSGAATVVIAEEPLKVYTIDLESVEIKKGVLSLIEYLGEKEGLNYSLSSDETFLNSIGNIKLKDNEFVYIYTSVKRDFDVLNPAEVSYEGKTLTSSGVGIRDMKVEDGAIIYFSKIAWGRK